MTAIQARLRILLVENESCAEMATEELLSELGHQIVGRSQTAGDAFRLAEQHRPDVIMMDLQLDGERDGISAASEIADRLGIASVFTSGAEDGLMRARARAARPLGYVRKPISLHELDRVLRIAECLVRKQQD